MFRLLANAGAILDDFDDGRYFRVSPCNRSSQSPAIAMLLYKVAAANPAEIFDITAEEVDGVVQRLNDRSDSVSNPPIGFNEFLSSYFLSKSRISARRTCSAEGAAGAAGAASSFFLSELISRTTMKMTNAMIVKSTTVWMNFP